MLTPTDDLPVYRFRASRETKAALDQIAATLRARGLTRVKSPTSALAFAAQCAALALNITPNGGRGPAAVEPLGGRE
jgi:hypothetical protein